MKKSDFKNRLKKLVFSVLFFSTAFVFSQDKSIELRINISNSKENKSAKLKGYNVAYKNASPFVMLSGYSKDITFSGTVFYRLKVNGVWNNWTAFNKPHNEEGIIDRVALGEVFIDTSFEDVQFKSSSPTQTPFVFRLFYPEFSKNFVSNTVKTVNREIVSGCSQPAYQGRSDWCPSGNCPKSSSPSAINPTHIVIHHSAGNTSSSDFAAVVRSYWDLHVNTNGWADIGYNWLVDPNGVLYEGRGDRIRGAHSPCMNGVATGICYIGNFETSEPAATGLTALKDFIAWEATDKNINVLTNSQAGALGVMDHISGHKDGKTNFPSSNCTSTLCPGANLHNKIAGIKTAVSNYACYVSSASVPSKPISFSVTSKSLTSVDVHIKAVATATTYGVYKSTDNITYQKVIESSDTTISIENLTAGVVTYFKVEAVNADGVSDKSSVLAALPGDGYSQFLIVDGVERRQFDAIAQYDYPLTELGHTFASATNDAVQDGTINLNDYKFVIWMLVDESSADDTFNATEQTKVKSFIDNGGVFIVSGDEIGWDLVHKGNAADTSFYENYLKAEYIADNPTPNNRQVKSTSNVTFNLDDGTHGTFDADYPDVIKPKNGSVKTFSYDGVSDAVGVAGVSYTSGNGGVEHLAFAIEIVYDDTQRKNLIADILQKYTTQLSVKDSFIEKNIKLYPNPTNGIVQISNPNNIDIQKVSVFTMYGQLLQSKVVANQLDLSSFSTGIYIIKIESKTGEKGVFRVIKK